MIVVDANVLLYAVNERSAHHRPARDWLIRTLEGGEPLGFAWTVLLAFLRLSTRPGLFPRPLTPQQASTVLTAWLHAPAAVVLHPGSRHPDVLHGLLAQAGTAGNLVNDAHLAALAAEHGATVVSYDRDMGRFTGVPSRVPG